MFNNMFKMISTYKQSANRFWFMDVQEVTCFERKIQLIRKKINLHLERKYKYKVGSLWKNKETDNFEETSQ